MFQILIWLLVFVLVALIFFFLGRSAGQHDLTWVAELKAAEAEGYAAAGSTVRAIEAWIAQEAAKVKAAVTEVESKV